jgi:hypothetical protein
MPRARKQPGVVHDSEFIVSNFTRYDDVLECKWCSTHIVGQKNCYKHHNSSKCVRARFDASKAKRQRADVSNDLVRSIIRSSQVIVTGWHLSVVSAPGALICDRFLLRASKQHSLDDRKYCTRRVHTYSNKFCLWFCREFLFQGLRALQVRVQWMFRSGGLSS